MNLEEVKFLEPYGESTTPIKLNKMKRKSFNIRKTIIEKNISVILNDALGVVAEFNFDEATRLCQLLNSNSDSNCRYQIEARHNEKD